MISSDIVPWMCCFHLSKLGTYYEFTPRCPRLSAPSVSLERERFRERSSRVPGEAEGDSTSCFDGIVRISQIVYVIETSANNPTVIYTPYVA